MTKTPRLPWHYNSNATTTRTPRWVLRLAIGGNRAQKQRYLPTTKEYIALPRFGESGYLYVFMPKTASYPILGD